MTLSQAFLANNGFKTAAEDFRNFVQATFRGGQGLIFASDFTLSPGSGLSMNYGPGYAVVNGTALATQGSYFVWDDTGSNVTWPAANPTNPRIDAMVLFVCDSQYGTATVGDGAQFIVVQGTAGGSPTAPTNATVAAAMPGPGGWLRVANVTVPANATGLISGNIAVTAFPAANSRLVQTVLNPTNAGNLGTSPVEMLRIYMPANSLQAGQVVQFKVAGSLSAGGVGNWPLVSYKLNNTTSWFSAPAVSAWGDTNNSLAPWWITGSFQCQSTGTSGTLTGEIGLLIGQQSGSNQNQYIYGSVSTSALTIDTTSNEYMSVCMYSSSGTLTSWNITQGWAEKIW